MYAKKTLFSALVFWCSLIASAYLSAQGPAQQVPKGLHDSSPQIRISAIEEVVRQKQTDAVAKIAQMAKNDTFPHVREAACRALGNMLAKDHLSLLKYLTGYDSNASVRAAAQEAVDKIKGKIEPDQAEEGYETNEEHYIKPTLRSNEPELSTRYFAIGFGTMGGYGVANLNLRVRIPTKAPYLPSVGLELGAGWSPPGMLPVITGLTDMGMVTDGDNRWKIISGAGGVLFYLHRLHYIPVRGGWNLATGGFATLGYGFELLNQEGFFSWGLEIGMTIQPVAKDKIERVTDWDENVGEERPDVWPVIPYVRFSIQFYLI